MHDFRGRARLRYWLRKLEPLIEGVLFLMSAAAVLFIVVNEFVPDSHVIVPWLGVSWSHLRNLMQDATWSAFIIDVALFGIVAARPFSYARDHVVELIICVSWNPFTSGVLLQHVTSILSLQTLVLIGTVAHVIRIARWTSRRFSEHPIVVITAAAAVLITASASVLMQVEPETFKTFQDAAFFVFMTIFTVGSDLNPHSTAGRIVTCAMTAGGIALGTLFLSTMAPLIARRLFPGSHINEKLLAQLTKQSDQFQELIAQQRESNELARRRLALLEEQLQGRASCTAPSKADEPAANKED